MALKKPTFFLRLKSLRPSSFRLLSFSTPEEAAADRRRRKLRLGIQIPPNSLPEQAQKPIPQNSFNAPKLPEHASVLTGKRLDLHNQILKLIRENNLEEAALLTRHSIYSNCKPSIFTCNSVMAAQLRQCRYSDLLSLHRFITQAGVAANIVTYNLVINAYLDCGKIDTALENYKQLINNAPFRPSPTTYIILVKGLVDNDKVDKALELKDEMLSKGFQPNPLVYAYLMSGQARKLNPAGIFDLHDELLEKLGGEFVYDGVVYGNMMKGGFLLGQENKAMECYQLVVDDNSKGENSKIKMSPTAYNFILEALTKNGKFEEAVKLFGRIEAEHNPPKRLTVNLGSYNVMVDAFCAEGKCNDAIAIFKSMEEKRCVPDTLSYNNLIEHLCNNGLLAEAEELYRGMSEKGVSSNETTFVLLMDTCFKENRPDAAANYFKTMVESKLKPNLGIYNRLVDGLVKFGKVDEAKSFFDMMVGKLMMDEGSYKFIMKSLFDIGKQDEVLKIVANMLRNDATDFTKELQEFVKEEMGKKGRDDELVKLMEDIEREKAEAAAREVEAAEKAKASARAAVYSIIPSKLYGNKASDKDLSATGQNAVEAISGNAAQVQESGPAEAMKTETVGETEVISDSASA